VSYCPAILPGDPQCPFYQQVPVVLVVEELLDLLPNFLIATDRNISRIDLHSISIRISRSRGFKFPIGTTRRATTSPHRLRELRRSSRTKCDRATVGNGQELSIDLESDSIENILKW
jgi:hypothetical protein